MAVGGYGVHSAKEELDFFQTEGVDRRGHTKVCGPRSEGESARLGEGPVAIGILGTTAQSLVALKNTVNRVAIKNRAQTVLNRPVTAGEAKTILTAHNVGRGESGS